MAKYEVTLSIEPQIIIEDVEKFTKAFVGKECGFSKCMWVNDSIEEACEQFLVMFYHETKNFIKKDNGTYVYQKFIEGLGKFENEDGDLWVASDCLKEENENEYGGISFILPNNGEVDVDWECKKVG